MREPANIDRDIAVYVAHQERFEAEHPGQWVVVFDEDVIGFYASFEEAAEIAVARFDRGPYLIRLVGERTANLPDTAIFGH